MTLSMNSCSRRLRPRAQRRQSFSIYDDNAGDESSSSSSLSYASSITPEFRAFTTSSPRPVMLSIMAFAALSSFTSFASAFTASHLRGEEVWMGGRYRIRPTPTTFACLHLGRSTGFDSSFALHVTSHDNSSTTRVSKRTRIRQVLNKARGRTGIRNNTSPPQYNDKFEEDSGAQTKNAARLMEKNGFNSTIVSERNTVAERSVHNQSVGSVIITNRENTAESITDVSDDDDKHSSQGGAESYGVPTRRPATVIAQAATLGAISDSDPVDLGIVPLSASASTTNKDTPLEEFSNDVLKSDVSAAFSMPVTPLPFQLPQLTPSQLSILRAGERVEYQEDMGRAGSGFVVFDVTAPSEAVWECLLDFHEYPNLIPTVRDMTMFTNTHVKESYHGERPIEQSEDGTYARLEVGIPSVTRAAFTLSKFRLKIAAVHKYRPHPEGDHMIFTLDPACTNLVLQKAKGVWHTQTNPDNKGDDVTRVWLLCELTVSRVLPSWIVDYAAKRAMPRATSWLKPAAEAASQLWLKRLPDDKIDSSSIKGRQ
mmetsp:Transcript_9624/g.21371  ORF Transcript_9624/g.21371 Transcript_9624/m.21371 type:complete len:540 (-) Transcript_9624:279-1898(-)